MCPTSVPPDAPALPCGCIPAELPAPHLHSGIFRFHFPSGLPQKTVPWQNILLRREPDLPHFYCHLLRRTTQNNSYMVHPRCTYMSGSISTAGQTLPCGSSAHMPSFHRTFPLCAHHDCRCPLCMPCRLPPHDRNAPPHSHKKSSQMSAPLFSESPLPDTRTLQTHCDTFPSQMLPPSFYSFSPLSFMCDTSLWVPDNFPGHPFLPGGSTAFPEQTQV
jgi:hypothetical protein